MKRMKLLLLLLSLVISASFSYAKKKQDANYIARRTAAIQEMDSLLRYSGEMPHVLMELADMKCKEFKRDPVLMRAIASSFATNAGLIENSKARYQEIKKRYPKDFESYSDYAATFFDYSIKVNPNSSLTRDPEWFNLAKAQMDSAKVVFPQSKAPYLWWITRCAFYAYSDSMQAFINDEVEELRRKFPDNNAYYDAATILGNKKDFPLNMENFDHVYFEDGKGGYIDKWFFIAEDKRDCLTQFYYDKADNSTLTPDQLTNISYYYYVSTEIKNITRTGRALLYKKGLERATLGMQKYPDNDNFKYLQLWNAAELARYHYLIANSDSVRRMYGEDRKREELDLCNSYSYQALQAYESLHIPTDSIDYKAVMYAAMAKQYSEKYEDALQLYRQALNNMQYVKLKNRASLYKAQYHDLDSLTAYQNISDCYKNLNGYEKAIKQLNALFDLRKGHGGQLKRIDLLDLIKLYMSIGYDTLKTQQERFAAYVAMDSLYATIQDSIDAGNELFTMPEGYAGMYLMRRMVARMSIDKLSEYAGRENYLPVEIAEEIVRRIEPLPEKSENEKTFIGSAFEVLWREYYKNKDYKNALKYIDLELKYDPDKKEMYGRTIEYLTKLAKKQR